MRSGAGVDDVLHDDHMVLAHIVLQVHRNRNASGGLRVAEVAFRLHEVYLAGDVYRSAKVGEKHERALENAHEQQRLAGVKAADVLSRLLNGITDIVLGEKDLLMPRL